MYYRVEYPNYQLHQLDQLHRVIGDPQSHCTVGIYSFCIRMREVGLRVPTGAGKPGQMRQLFPVREKSGNFEKMPKSQGKVRYFKMSQGKL